MMNLKKILLLQLVLFSVLSSFFLLAPVKAQVENNEGQAKTTKTFDLSETRENLNEKRENIQTTVQEARKVLVERVEDIEKKINERKEERCNRIETNIQNRIDRFDNNYSVHQERYEKIKENIESLLTGLEDNGYDVSEARALVSQFEDTRQEMRDAYTNFIDVLRDMQILGCGDDTDSYLAKIENAKTARDLLISQANETKLFVKEQLIEELNELKSLFREGSTN